MAIGFNTLSQSKARVTRIVSPGSIEHSNLPSCTRSGPPPLCATYCSANSVSLTFIQSFPDIHSPLSKLRGLLDSRPNRVPHAVVTELLWSHTEQLNRNCFVSSCIERQPNTGQRKSNRRDDRVTSGSLFIWTGHILRSAEHGKVISRLVCLSRDVTAQSVLRRLEQHKHCRRNHEKISLLVPLLAGQRRDLDFERSEER